jgi:hypothetical protein
MKTHSRATPFQNTYIHEYGLRVVTRDVNTLEVQSVECLFCIYFGRAPSVPESRQRKLTSRIKSWTAPWRAELFSKHHEHQHSSQWKEYQSACFDDKRAFFDNKEKFKDTIHYAFGKSADSLVFKVNPSIVEEIIGDMFFHPDDHGGISQQRALQLFTRQTPENEFTITIKKPTEFYIAVDFISHGLSFRQVENAFESLRKRRKLISPMYREKISNVARIVCAVNLQRLSSLLNNPSMWAFSLASDGSTHWGQSYLDNRIRFYFNGTLYNVHLLAIPMFERHTADNIVKLISQLLDIICPTWTTKLIGLGSDGEAKMTGQFQGVITELEKKAKHPIYRTWCGLHQLDLVMQAEYKTLFVLDKAFVTVTVQYIGHLRQQYKLIAEMRSTCPKLANRWVVMGNVCDWFLQYRVRLLQFARENSNISTVAENTPPHYWWIIVAAVAAITSVVNITFVKLQSKDLLVSQQLEELRELAVQICSGVGVEGPYDTEDTISDEHLWFIDGRWRVKTETIFEFLYDQGSFVIESLDKLVPEDQYAIVKSVSLFILQTINGILDIQAERTSDNLPADDLPPVLPHNLVRLRGKEFNGIVTQNRPRLSSFWDDITIDIIEQQFKKLRFAYLTEPILKAALNKCDANTGFDDGWALVEGRDFDVLKDFCGCLATVFPNTASVESDFSQLAWEKDEYRMSITDLSLEGVLQCKQFELLSSLVELEI